ncbi:hypothetical protein EI94DRAFT_1749648 [Lactarius quietus]|nr:hypothetical protein EI94DRAFT_1749648 [Lactarius quietus]
MGFWLTVAQATIGKLYVLSLFYQLYVASISPALQWFTSFPTSCLAMLDINYQTSSLRGSHRHSLCLRRLCVRVPE